MADEALNSKLTRWPLAAILAGLLALSWSGMCMGADAITEGTLTSAAAGAKTQQNYQELAAYFEAQANDANKKADQIKAQYGAIYGPSGLRTGADQEETQQWGIYAKVSSAHYLGLAQQDENLAKMYRRKAQSAAGH